MTNKNYNTFHICGGGEKILFTNQIIISHIYNHNN